MEKLESSKQVGQTRLCCSYLLSSNDAWQARSQDLFPVSRETLGTMLNALMHGRISSFPAQLAKLI